MYDTNTHIHTNVHACTHTYRFGKGKILSVPQKTVILPSTLVYAIEFQSNEVRL